MRITHTVDFKKIAVITAGGKRLVVNGHRFVDFVKGRIFAGPIDTHPPFFTVGTNAGGVNFTADFNQIIFMPGGGNQRRNLIHRKAFGNRIQIKGERGQILDQKMRLLDLYAFKSNRLHPGFNFGGRGLLRLPLRRPEAP